MAEAPRLSAGKKALFALVCLGLCLVVAELVHRVIAWRRYAKYRDRFESQVYYAAHDVLPYVLRPGTWTNDDWGGALAGPDTVGSFTFTVNERRLRGPAPAPDFPAEGTRILCLGGSTTFGTGCRADSLSYPGQLEARLRGRFPGRPLEVLNGGVPRYRSAESLLNLGRLADLAPDLVLIYHGINDIVWCDPGAHYADPENVPRERLRHERAEEKASVFLVQELWRQATGYYPEKYERGTGYVHYPEARESFRGNLTRMVEKTRGLGGEAVLLTFATRLRDELSAEERQAVVDGPLFQDYFPSYEAMDEALKAYNGIVREVAEATGAPLIELEGLLPSEGRYWTDFCHLSAEGTALMIDRLEEPLAALVAGE